MALNTALQALVQSAAHSRMVRVCLVTALFVFVLIFQNGSGTTSIIQEARGDDFFAESTRVEVKGNRLSVSLVDADLDEVLKEIGRQGNITIVYKNPPDKRVTVSFDNLSMEQGLDKLLQEQNILLTYSRTETPEGQKPQYTISHLFLLEKSNAKAPQLAPAAAAPAQVPSQPTPPLPAPESVPPSGPESPAAPEPPDGSPLPEIPPDVISDILAQDPEVQEELLSTLHEAMQQYPEEISGQLKRMLDEMQKQGLTESETFQGALEQMLREGGPPPDVSGQAPRGEEER